MDTTRFADAELELTISYEVLCEQYSPEHPYARGLAQELARLFDRSGDTARAEEWRGLAR